MSEAAAKAAIRRALGREAALFHNPVGNGWMGKTISEAAGQVTLANPRRVAFGLCPGAADLIGFRRIVITPDMIGTTVAVFVAIEVKAPGGKHPISDEQRAFLAAVSAAGGLCGVARTPDQARLALGILP